MGSESRDYTVAVLESAQPELITDGEGLKKAASRLEGQMLTPVRRETVFVFARARDAFKFAAQVLERHDVGRAYARFGVHTGKLAIVAGEPEGSAPRIAVRLAQNAHPGGIAASRQAIERIEPMPPADFAGEKYLPEVSSPVAVFRIAPGARGDLLECNSTGLEQPGSLAAIPRYQRAPEADDAPPPGAGKKEPLIAGGVGAWMLLIGAALMLAAGVLVVYVFYVQKTAPQEGGLDIYQDLDYGGPVPKSAVVVKETVPSKPKPKFVSPLPKVTYGGTAAASSEPPFFKVSLNRASPFFKLAEVTAMKIEAQINPVAVCLEPLGADAPKVGSILIAATLDPEGKLTKVNAKGCTGCTPGVYGCLEKRAAGWYIPGVGADEPLELHIPLLFERMAP